MAVTSKRPQRVVCPQCGWTLCYAYHAYATLRCPRCKGRITLDYDGTSLPEIRVKEAK